MKKLLLFFMAFIFALAIIGCDGSITTTEMPTTTLTTTEEVTTQSPTTEAPTTVEVTTEAPTTIEVTTEAPTTVAPTTVAPTTETPTTEIPDVTYTIYYYNSEGWDEVYAYAWDTEGTLLGETMPGTLATQDGETDWWSIDVVGNIDVSTIGILFNNGDGLQTPDIILYSSMYVYMTYSGQSFMSKLLAEDSITSTRVYFYNALGWDEVNAYAWNGQSYILGPWQGTLATADETNEHWYYVDVPYNPDQVSFNIKFSNSDASLDTNDFIVDSSTYVYISEIDKYDSMAAAEAAYPKTTIWFYNTEGWENVFAYTANGLNEPIIDWGFSLEMTQDSINSNWWYLDVLQDASVNPFTIIMSDNVDNQSQEMYIDTQSYVYATIDGTLFISKTEAETLFSLNYSVFLYYIDLDGWDHLFAEIEDVNGKYKIGYNQSISEQLDDHTWVINVNGYGDDGQVNFKVFDGVDTMSGTAQYTFMDNFRYMINTGELYYNQELAMEVLNNTEPTEVFFYSDDYDFSSVSAYVYVGNSPLYPLPGKAATLVEGTDNLWRVEIPINLENMTFTVRFIDYEDGRVTLRSGTTLIDDNVNIYASFIGQTYPDLASLQADTYSTTVYLYNEWGDEPFTVMAGGDIGDILGKEPGVTMTDEGDGWLSVVLPVDLSIHITGIHFAFDGWGFGLTLDNAEDIYITFSEGVFNSKEAAEAELLPTRVYFYNEDDWANPYAYALDGSDLELLGDGYGTIMTEDTENVGWYYIDVPVNFSLGSLSIQFSRGPITSDYSDLYTISDNSLIYFTLDSGIFSNMVDAEVATIPHTTFYYYNSEGWSEVYAYAYVDGIDITAADPGDLMIQDGTSDWWYITFDVDPHDASVHLKFSDGAGTYSLLNYAVANQVEVYLTYDEGAFTSKAFAEDAVAGETFTQVWFYNSLGWEEVYGFVEDETITPPSYPGYQAVDSIFNDWWYINVPVDVDSNNIDITFNNGTTELQAGSVHIISSVYIYTNVMGDAFDSQAAAELPTTASTTLYFYNSEEWTNMYAYIYIQDHGALLGALPGTALTEDLDTDWWTIDVPLDTSLYPITIVFTDTNLSESTIDISIDSLDSIYITYTGQTFTSKTEAEEAMIPSTTVWYYNSEGWTEVYAYAFDSLNNEYTETWPGTLMTQDGLTQWWYLEVPYDFEETPLMFKFNNNDFSEAIYASLDNATDVYVTYYGETFSSDILAEAGYANPTMTDVYFYNTDGWTSVSAFAFDDFSSYLGTWPGTTATQVDTSNWWVISVPSDLADTITFVFNNGEEGEANLQTADIDVNLTTGVYVVASANVYQDQVTAESSLETITRIYFYNPSSLGWTQPYAHIWNYSGTNPSLTGTWPGNPLTQDTTDPDWWYVDISTTTASFNIVMNNGEGTQSPDYTIYSYDEVYILFGDDGFGNTFLDLFPSLALAEEVINISE